jgi:NADPH-dependent ferric siderophore reductase
VVDAVLHGHGPGSTWAESLQLDDEVTFFGPRGEISLSDASAADWVLCITDEAGLPAVGALVESTDRPVLVLAEIAAADERYPLSPNADVRWLVRADHPAGSADLFTAALDEVVPGQLGSDARTGRGYAYVLAESRAAVVLRDELARFGLSKSEVYAKGYWNLRSRSTR